MNSKRIQLFLIFVLCFLLVNQVFPQADKKDAKNTAGKMPGIEQQTHTGTVIQTFDSGGYTYLEFMENKKKLWAAALKFRVKAGDKISFSQAAPMGNFYSKTLKRTFKTILFVGQVRVLNAGRTEIKKKIPGFSHPEVKRGKKKKYKLKPGSIPKAKEGYTVEECFLNRDKLKGKIISIRGMVVKFTA